MRKRQRLLRMLGISAAVGGMVVSGMVVAGQASTPATAADSGAESAGAPGTWVTLVTGDRVRLSADGTSRVVEPGPGRDGIGFSTSTYEGHTYVIPSDAMHLVANGKLDRRLFDVTGLVKQGHADSERATVPLLASYGGTGDRTTLTSAGLDVTRDLSAIDGAAADIAKSEATERWTELRNATESGAVERVWLDGVRKPLLDESVPQIGAPDAWDAGYTGKGVTVGVLDTGVDAEHPDLDGQVVGEKNFTDEAAGDKVGHGTHVASTIAGTGAASDGRYKGVAPDAKVLDGKVCAAMGCTESAILAGMEWAAKTKQADVVNMSLGGGDTSQIDPLERAVNTLTEETGALFVVAAGNSGPNGQSIGSPGSADAALTVGAVTKRDRLAEFSSRGPRIGDSGLKPDITAPGVEIAAAKAKGTQLGSPVGKSYVRASGTSMATPHVVGAAALLAQQHEDWDAGQVKAALMASAEPSSEHGVFDQGAGRVDLTNAIEQTIVSEPASVSFGRQKWPHDDDEPITKSLTYRNTGDEDVILDLRTAATGPDGQPAPDGMFTLSKDRVTVPAGGTASVEITADTAPRSGNGLYGGYVVASRGSEPVARTPIGVNKEVESYDLTLKTIGTNGKPAAMGSAMLYGLNVDELFAVAANGTTTVRVPKGSYLVHATVLEKSTFHAMVQPTLTVDKDLTITADARDTEPMNTTVDKPGAVPTVAVSYQRRAEQGPMNTGYLVQDWGQIRTEQLGPDTSTAGMLGVVDSQWGKPGSNSPYVYALHDVLPGKFFSGYRRDVDDGELAVLESSRNAQVDDRQAYTTLMGWAPEEGGPTAGIGFPFDLPSETTYYLEASDVKWRMDHEEIERGPGGEPRTVSTLRAPGRTYEAGKTYENRWNAAVFGPSAEHAFVNQDEERIRLDVPMYSDADGHAGSSSVDHARTVLSRDGEQIGQSDKAGSVEADVQPGKATYELTTEAERSSYSTYATKTKASWTFESDLATDAEALPLWSARFVPNVDEHNVSRDGRVAEVPVRLESSDGGGVGEVSEFTVEVSTDDGRTWKPAKLTPDGENAYVATVRTPADAKFVSLRSSITDDKGNQAEASIIRAYGLAR